MSLMTPTKAKRSARRCLFGRPDPKETKQWLDKQLEAISRKDVEKWGFDFAHEQPLPGSSSDYEFRPCMESSVPSFYKNKFIPASSPLIESSPECENRDPLLDSTVDSDSSDTMDCSISSASSYQATPKKRSSKQAKVTDYLKPRKRLHRSPKTTDLSSAPSSPRRSLRV